MKRLWLTYPIFFALSKPLSLYLHNVEIVQFNHAADAFNFVILASGGLYLLFIFVLRKVFSASLVMFIIFFMIYMFVPFFDLLGGTFFRVTLQMYRVVLVLWISSFFVFCSSFGWKED